MQASRASELYFFFLVLVHLICHALCVIIFKGYNQNLWEPLFVGAPGQLPTLPPPKSGPVIQFVIVHKAMRMLCCESSRKCHHAAQTTPTWTKPILTCFTKCIAVQVCSHPWPNMNEQYTKLN